MSGAAVRGDGQDDLAPAGPREQRGLRLRPAVSLYRGRGSAALQERDPGQYLRRLAQHQAQGDGVQAGSARLVSEQQAQQVRVGEPRPQRPVEAFRDGAGNLVAQTIRLRNR